MPLKIHQALFLFCFFNFSLESFLSLVLFLCNSFTIKRDLCGTFWNSIPIMIVLNWKVTRVTYFPFSDLLRLVKQLGLNLKNYTFFISIVRHEVRRLQYLAFSFGIFGFLIWSMGIENLLVLLFLWSTWCLRNYWLPKIRSPSWISCSKTKRKI